MLRAKKCHQVGGSPWDEEADDYLRFSGSKGTKKELHNLRPYLRLLLQVRKHGSDPQDL